MTRGSRLRHIGWMMVLGACVTCYLALSFHVGSIKSQVHLAERDIVELEREKIILETEFETRANQQQLANWNRIEFGYHPPQAEQYLETERQLAALGEPRSQDAPKPIRVARSPVEGEEGFLAMVSPLTGEAIDGGAEAMPHTSDKEAGAKPSDAAPSGKRDNSARKEPKTPSNLADRLTRDIAIPSPVVEMQR